MYRRGLGIAPNPGRATAWLQRAALRGDEEARAKLWEMYGDSAALVSPSLPYSVNELTELIENGVGSKLILELVGESCLRFSVDSAAVEKLLAARATSNLMVGIRSACHAPTAGEERPISATQGDSLTRLRAPTPADSAKNAAVAPFADSTTRRTMEAALRTMVNSVAAAGSSNRMGSKPTVSRHSRSRVTKSSLARDSVAHDAVEHDAVEHDSVLPRKRVGGALLDAAKKDAEQAAEDQARRKAGDAVKRLLN